MRLSKRYIIFLAFMLAANYLPAQNITGTWEGDMGDYQFLQLNVIQNGDKLCGYTWDYVKGDRRSYCKAYFEGHYDKRKDQWLFQGTSFIEGSEDHFLMRIKLTNRFVDGENVLEGFSSVKSLLLKLLSSGEDDSVYLKKVSSRPLQILENMYDCFLEEKKSKDTTTITNIPEKKTDSIVPAVPEKEIISTNADTLTTVPEKITDSLVTIIPPPINKADSISIPEELVKRKNKEQSHIEVNVKTITLNVYDNALIDGDTVSIFYNGKLLLSHQRLSEKPIVINIELDEKQTRHEIILFAENLGSIPPNTALVVIYAGEKRYELFSSANLKENAVLVFDYKPK